MLPRYHPGHRQRIKDCPVTAQPVALDFHPLRTDLYQELHSRPFQVLPPRARVTHIAVMTTPEQRKSQFKHLQALHRMLRSEEHTSELQSRENLVCRLLLEKKN